MNRPVLPPGVVMETRLSHLRGARYAMWVTDPLDNGDTRTSDITRPQRHHRAPWRLSVSEKEEINGISCPIRCLYLTPALRLELIRTLFTLQQSAGL
jgi:hypothetical protein